METKPTTYEKVLAVRRPQSLWVSFEVVCAGQTMVVEDRNVSWGVDDSLTCVCALMYTIDTRVHADFCGPRRLLIRLLATLGYALPNDADIGQDPYDENG